MIYLDNAATTRMCDEAFSVLKKYYCEDYFNPSAVYGGAISVRAKIEDTRELVAKVLCVNTDNIFFTSGGTEGDNMAIFGANKKSVGKIVCSSCEHPAVYNCFLFLQQKGFDVEFIPCKRNGMIDVDAYNDIVKNNVISFASIMHINNETGGINDILSLSKTLKKYNPDAVFHSDGVQAFMKTRINLSSSEIDLYSFSSHKINGPKGVGGIYVKNPNKIYPLLFGGGQEKGSRSGTENTAGIIAFGEAVKLWKENRVKYLENFTKFRNIVINSLENIDDVIYNTCVELSSPHILSVTIGGIKGEVLLHILESNGIYIGRGSACSTKETSPRALKALNIDGEGTIRVSFGIYNTVEEIKEFSKILAQSIVELRQKMRG